MPKVLEVWGYIIYIWSNEQKPLEPIHVHVSKRPTKNGTKIWIFSNGSTSVAHNKSRIPPRDLKRLRKTISEYRDVIEKAWKEHFGIETIIYKDMEKLH